VGKPIKNLDKEAAYLPRSLRDMLERQAKEEEIKKSKVMGKKKALEKRTAPKATMFLGDEGINSGSESDISDEDPAQDKPEPSQTTKPNQSTKQGQSSKSKQTTNQNSSNQKRPKRKLDEISKKPGKRDETGKGKDNGVKGKGKGKQQKGNEKEEPEEEKRVQEFWELSDNVKFGETSDRPPTITVRPRKALKQDIQNDAKKIAVERAREKAVMAYAASKKRKATNTGNKFFL